MDKILTLTPIPSFVIDAEYRISQISASYLALAHLTLEECLGADVYEFVRNKTPLPHLDSVRTAIEKAVASKDIYVIENIPTENGTYWSIRAAPIFKDDDLLYVLFEVQNSTDQHQRLQALDEERYENETYRILVDTVKDYAIFMLDIQGNVATWNVGAALLKGYKREDIIGQHFSKFYSMEDRIAGKPGKGLEVCVREGRMEDEGWRYRKDGSRFWANVVITTVYRSAVHIGFSKVTRDLTDRRAAEARLISAYEESAKLKSDFLANMSHEIRTPMHGLLSALTLLRETQLTTEQQELGSIMQESGSVLLQVINDILDYSKLTSGCFSVKSDVIAISDIVHSVTKSFQTTLQAGVRLEVSIDQHLPSIARGDPLRYRQILQNLVGNAAKFTESGCICVQTSLSHQDDHCYTIITEITDSGIGIACSAITSLFTPFTQFDTSATKIYQGTGLGLSISRSLAELMGGAIGFKQNPKERGSIFWFTVKLWKIDTPNSLDLANEKLAVVPPTTLSQAVGILREVAPHKRILLAEDNMLNQKVMLKMLKSIGFDKVDTAHNGANASKLVRETPERYNVVLMDINMPILDGIGATIEIHRAGIGIPIIAMTANALEGTAEAFLAKGLDDYITKPVDKQLLMRILLKWLQ